jgi:hypothetical protein
MKGHKMSTGTARDGGAINVTSELKKINKVKVKFSPLQALEALRVVRG